MKTLLAFSTLPARGPSVRPRVLAYREALAAAGIELRLLPFLSPRGFAGFYSTTGGARIRKAVHAGFGGLRRIRDLLAARRAGAALIHRELLPRGNRPAIRWLRRRGVRVAYDLDDALWLSPRDYVAKGEESRRRMTRLKDPGEVDDLIRGADVVLAGNGTIAEHARPLCRDVRLLPTPVDTRRFSPRGRPGSPRERPLVGWIGSPTAAYCLLGIRTALARAAAVRPFDLLVVGAGEPIEVPGVRVIERPWSLASEPEEFASLDVGLYPLPDNDWTRGKCGMKALLYLASGVAPIVSPVGVNREIVEDGRTGSFATTQGEWADRLLAYLADPALRAAHAAAGRARVTERYSLAALAPVFTAAVGELLS
jgi:glycosyltransferase involved in cell wall biosynthesis